MVSHTHTDVTHISHIHSTTLYPYTDIHTYSNTQLDTHTLTTHTYHTHTVPRYIRILSYTHLTFTQSGTHTLMSHTYHTHTVPHYIYILPHTHFAPLL